MTQEEKATKSYLKDICHRLHLPRKVKAGILADLESEIHARLEKGEKFADILSDMGTAKDVAEGFNTEMMGDRFKGSPFRFVFLGLAILIGVLLIAYTFIRIFNLPQGPIVSLITGVSSSESESFTDNGVTTSSYTQYLDDSFLPQWFTVIGCLASAFLGSIAAYLLLKWHHPANIKQYWTGVLLSLSGIVLFVSTAIATDIYYFNIDKLFAKQYPNYSGIGYTETQKILNFLSYFITPFSLLPFWLPVVTFIVILCFGRKRKTASQAVL
ncbi:MAG TPA: hypothetical protein VHP31_11730 [Caproicibacter sp.]|nr:hypothetical protein [Caproicibacter sp.]